MRQRHALARQQRQQFKSTFGEESTPSYKEFFQNETPYTEKLVKYEVSYQISYRGNTQALETTSKTFTVVGLQGQTSELQERTMNMILDSKGQKTQSNFAVNTLRAVKNSTDITIRPRGLEPSQKDITKDEIAKVSETGFLLENLDDVLEFKNKQGRKGRMSLDTRHFTYK